MTHPPRPNPTPPPPPGPPFGEALLPVKDAADVLAVNKQTVYRMVWDGLLPAVNIGTGKRPRLRIRRTVLEAYLARRDMGAAA